jgi:predicted nucleic-acid-binding Zn-ribbon protein
MKEKHVCPRCRNNEVLYVKEVNDEMDSHSRNWRIARVKYIEEGIFGQKRRVNMVGRVEAYICRRCGYTELYTKDPESLPIDGENVVLLKGPDDVGPYR